MPSTKQKTCCVVTLTLTVSGLLFTLIPSGNIERLQWNILSSHDSIGRWLAVKTMYYPGNVTTEDVYFQYICGQSQMAIPSKIFSEIHLDTFENGMANVTIQTYDKKKNKMTVGGDVVLVWAEQVDGIGRVSGVVHDKGNGTYIGHVKIFWRGLTKIRAKIAASVVNTCLLYRALKRYGNAVYAIKTSWGLNAVFKHKFLWEKTRCGTTNYLYGYREVCNFTTRNDDSPWYCGKPRSHTLHCNHIYSYGTGRFIVRGVGSHEKVHDPGHGTLKMFVQIYSPLNTYYAATETCRKTPRRVSWTAEAQSGFLGDVWNPTHCRGPSEHNSTIHRQCLKGKNLIFIGDSTVRQYFEHIGTNIMVMGKVDVKNDFGANRTFHPNTVLSNYNISARYRKHELPFHNPDVRPNGVRSVPGQLQDIADSDLADDSLVIVVNYFSHFLAFPSSQYRKRLRNLKHAIEYLLTAKTRATLFYKSPHVCIDDTRWFNANFGLLYRDILFEEFRDVMDHVIYLDTWDITVAHNSEELHPHGRCMQSQIEQMMAYLCG